MGRCQIIVVEGGLHARDDYIQPSCLCHSQEWFFFPRASLKTPGQSPHWPVEVTCHLSEQPLGALIGRARTRTTC